MCLPEAVLCYNLGSGASPVGTIAAHQAPPQATGVAETRFKPFVLPPALLPSANPSGASRSSQANPNPAWTGSRRRARYPCAPQAGHNRS